jgi:putative MATE family efflux protein
MNDPNNDSPENKKPHFHNQTKGVETLLGDPKKAIIKLAAPIIVAMSAQTIYNLVDAIWVSGLGAGALAGVGFFFPFFFLSMAISTGIGVGGGAAISRRIGAKDKVGADSVGVHTFVIMIILAITFTIPFLMFAEPIFLAIGAEDVIDYTLAYSRVMFGGTIIIFFTMIATSVLRAEGDATRSMWVMMIGAVINIFLDPFFIYGNTSVGPFIVNDVVIIGRFNFIGFGFGIAGAAWATMISMSVSASVLYYWFFIKKDTFISFKFKNFNWDKKILRDIFKVGIPASVMQISMSITMLVMNVIIVYIAGFEGVSVYAVGWRVVTVAILPLVGMATAVTAVAGASFGANDHEKLKISFYYAIKVGLIIATCVAIITYIFAPQITMVFTYSEGTAEIADDIQTFLQIICLFYPGVAFGMFSSAMFQGSGKGTNALIVTILRSIILAIPLVLIFAFFFQLDLIGVWWGLVTANLLGSFIAFAWARSYIKGLKSKFDLKSTRTVKIDADIN